MTKQRIIVFVVACLIAWPIIGFVFHAFLQRPAASASRIDVEITSEMSLYDVAQTLEWRGVTGSTWDYRMYAKLDSLARAYRPGVYYFEPGLNYRSLARLLSLGPPREEAKVIVIEGWDSRDEAQALDFYVSSTVFAEHIQTSRWRDEFSFLYPLPVSSTLEGYLFPNTYRVWRDELPDSLIRKQLAVFGARAERIAIEAKKQGRSVQDVVTLASIVEKEVANSEERKIVAGIFLNRLRDGIALQSDATVNYITRSGRARSTQRDLQVDSLYNTYRHPGLPPGPIANPGDDALEAALFPASTDYRYFLTDVNGKIYYAETFAEHQKNRAMAFSISQ